MSTVVNTHRASQPLTFTQAAVKHIQNYLAKAQQGEQLRIAIKQTGCSGWQYDITFTKDTQETDITCEVTPDITAFIVKDAIEMIEGSVVDLIQDGLNKQLSFNNPNAAGICGCGESFMLKEEDEE